MANDKKSFKNATPMFGDESTKLAIERVDQLKAIAKFTKLVQKKSIRFLDTTPKTPPGETAGVETNAAEDGSTLTKEQQLQTKPKQPRTETVKNFSFELYAPIDIHIESTLYCVQNKHTEHDIALNKGI